MKAGITNLALCTVMSILIITSGHSGRTDSNGGHKDNNNVSGLGLGSCLYHYDCGRR